MDMVDTRRVDELHEWSKNKEFRQITTDNDRKLQADILANGVEDDLSIEEDGTIIDGNHRFKAVKELLEQGITESENGHDLSILPIKIVYPKSDGERWRIALRKQSDYAQTTDNLLNFQSEFEDFVDLNSLNIQLYEPKTIEQLLAQDEEPLPQKDERESKPEVIICPHCNQSFERG